MSWKLRTAIGCVTALTSSGALAATTSADGLPLQVDATNSGVTSSAGDYRYATVSAGSRTVALRIASDGGRVARTLNLHGVFGVPMVAYDGTPSGLSADGETLVLIRPRTSFPRKTTTFAVLDAERLRLRDQVTLHGDFSFDALSADGRLLYLIHYTDPRDLTAYEVRAYDLERARLLPDPIVDPDEPGEAMAGSPITRAVSADGRWAYTLYDTPDARHPPFIHALDTQDATAVCIDLDALADHRNVYRLGLAPSDDGGSLAVLARNEPVANVDLETFKVSEPASPASEIGGQHGVPWAGAGAAGAGAMIALALVALRRRRADHGRALAIDPYQSQQASEAELEQLVRLNGESRSKDDAKEREPVG